MLAARTIRRRVSLLRSFSASRVVTVESDADYNALLEKPKSVVYFTAQWCGPCKMIAPVYSQLSESFPNITFGKVDVDEMDEIAFAAGIRSMPTFQVHINGKIQTDLGFSGADATKLMNLVQEVDTVSLE